jgi:hypothetical protein
MTGIDSDFSQDSDDEIDVVEVDEAVEDQDTSLNESDDDSNNDSDNDYVAAPGAPLIAMSTLPLTGEPRVDDAMARLADLVSLPVSEHVGVFEDVQRRLHDTLADLSGS